MNDHEVFCNRLRVEFEKLHHEIDDGVLEILADMALDMLSEVREELLGLLCVFVEEERADEVVDAVRVLKNGPGLIAATYCLVTERVVKIYFRSYMGEE